MGLHDHIRGLPLTQGCTRVDVGWLELVDNNVTWVRAAKRDIRTSISILNTLFNCYITKTMNQCLRCESINITKLLADYGPGPLLGRLAFLNTR